jgi:hypothetical protein
LNDNFIDEKFPKQEGGAVFQGKDLQQLSADTRKLLSNERYFLKKKDLSCLFKFCLM